MTTECFRRRRRQHVRDATGQGQLRAVGELDEDLGLFAHGQQRLGPDEQAARREILGLGDDTPRGPVELDSTPADQPQIAASARTCHFPEILSSLEWDVPFTSVLAEEGSPPVAGTRIQVRNHLSTRVLGNEPDSTYISFKNL